MASGAETFWEDDSRVTPYICVDGAAAGGGQFVDPSGHRWHGATQVEDIPPQETEKRAGQAVPD